MLVTNISAEDSAGYLEETGPVSSVKPEMSGLFDAKALSRPGKAAQQNRTTIDLEQKQQPQLGEEETWGARRRRRRRRRTPVARRRRTPVARRRRTQSPAERRKHLAKEIAMKAAAAKKKGENQRARSERSAKCCQKSGSAKQRAKQRAKQTKKVKAQKKQRKAQNKQQKTRRTTWRRRSKKRVNTQKGHRKAQKKQRKAQTGIQKSPPNKHRVASQKPLRSQKDILKIASFARANKRTGKRTNRRRTARKQQNRPGSHSVVQGGISCLAEHGKRADCSRDPVAVKAAIKLVRRAGHKVNSQMLGSNQECMTTHEEMADCSQVQKKHRASSVGAFSAPARVSRIAKSRKRYLQQGAGRRQTAVLGEEATWGGRRRRRRRRRQRTPVARRRRTPVARRRRTPVARRRRTPSSRRTDSWILKRADWEKKRPKAKCSQPKLPSLKCPDGFMQVAGSNMNLDKVESGVRLIARAVSCKCTKMPRDVQKILKDARKCTVKLYKKNNLKGKILQKFVTSNTQGKTFLNNVAMKRPVQEMLTDDLGEAGKAHTNCGFV